MLQWWHYRGLVWLLLKREIQSEYRAMILGGLWPILTPLFDLVIYSFVFGILLKGTWPSPEGVAQTMPFGLILLAGLVPFNMFGEVFTTASLEILQKPSYVKKIVFPLEILPVVRVGVAWFHGSVGLLLVLGATWWVRGELLWTWLLLPLALLPLLFLSLGFAWGLASLGVYLRDLVNMVQVGLRLWFFITPIVYPPSLIPKYLAFVVRLNPLAFIVDSVRRVLLWGLMPQWGIWWLWVGLTGSFAWLGLVWFHYAKRGFADVL